MEKNNYNIKHNLKELSSEEIAKHQDFDALLQDFQAAEAAQPQVNTKVRRLWQIGLAAAAVFAGLLAYSTIFNGGLSAGNSTTDFLASQPYVNPPIKNAQAEFASYKIDAYEGGTYEYKSGSKIVIPPRAFVNRSGNFATGEVDIKYREYHNFVDFFMSGIPMEYDSSGVRYILESAGMIEVYAEQDGERLNMAPEEAINIELVSEINVKDPNNPPSYNIYKLDEEKRNWVYQTVDDIEVLEQVGGASELLVAGEETEASASVALQSEMTSIENRRLRETNALEASVPKPTKPKRPSKGNSTNFSFNLDILTPASPAIGNNLSEEHSAVNKAENERIALQKQYEGTIWEVLPNQPQFNESTASIVWDDFKLDRVGSQNFVLNLIEGDRIVKVNVMPVLMGKDYDNAMATFNAEMDKYQSELAIREAQLANRKEALNNAIALAQEIANKEYDEKIASLRAKGENSKATDEMLKHKIVNRFQISSFGVWNCDRPLPPYIYALQADIQDQFNKKYKGNIAYFVDKKRNTVNRFQVKDKTTIRFDKTAENLMWVVSDDNKFAVYRPEDFDKINYESNDHTFVLNLEEQEINSEEDAQKILQF